MDATSGLPPPELALLDPGRAPRRKLRYAWRSDQKEELAIDLRTLAANQVDPSHARGATDATRPSIPLAPAVRIVVAIDPTRVSQDGDLTYAWHVTSAVVRDEPAVPGSIADGMRAEVAAVEHLAGTAVVTSRGLARDVVVDPGSLVDGAAEGQMIEQVEQTIRDVAAPFPEEEVGLGARWQKLSHVTKDARVAQTETFTLVAFKAGKGVLDDVLAQTAGSQPLRAAGMPSGAQARVESMLVSADATTHFDPTRLVPQTRFESTSTMVLSGHSPGEQARRMTMVLRVEILLSGSIR